MNKFIGVGVMHALLAFVGQRVTISRDGRHEATALCRNIHETESGIDVELESGNRYGIVPTLLTPNSMEGNLGHARGTRKIELIP